jgi:hypothetical protein
LAGHTAFTWSVLDRLLEDERIVNSSLMREMRAMALYQILMGRTYSPHHPHPGPPPSRGREHAVKPSPLMGEGWEGVNAAPLSS